MQAHRRDLTAYRAHVKCHAYDTSTACPFLAALIPPNGVFPYTCVYVTMEKRIRLQHNGFGRSCVDPYDEESQTRAPRQKHKAVS